MKRLLLINFFVYRCFVLVCAIFCVSLLVISAGVSSNSIIEPVSVLNKQEFISKNHVKKHVLVVFIHGTIMSWVPNIYTYQPFGCDGLHDISYEPNYIRASPSAFFAALLYEKMCEFVTSSADNAYSFCTFSWSGRLSVRQRARSADDLYRALIQKIKDLRVKYSDKDLEVYLLGHSHGGNVLLNLAASEEKFREKLVIDKAVLLGTPVQSKTEKFVYSSIFKDVYSFFSYGDFVQILDILSSPDASSRRRFDSYEKVFDKKKDSNNLGSRVRQISVKIDGLSPRHNELWCFGGSGNYMYRDDLLIAPLPVVAFMPIILDFIDRYMKNATYMQLRINQQKSSYKFSCVDRRKSPKKYKNCYYALSFDDIMGDFLGDTMVPEFCSAFRLLGLDLN